jgi:naphthoate synthase
MDWITVKEYEDITYKKCNGVARIAFNRPDVRNAFRPKRHQNYTVHSMMRKKILYVVLLSAEGPSSKDGVYSFVVVEIKMHVVIRVM